VGYNVLREKHLHTGENIMKKIVTLVVTFSFVFGFIVQASELDRFHSSYTERRAAETMEKNKETLLHKAVDGRWSIDLVRDIPIGQREINAECVKGYTALHYAVSYRPRHQNREELEALRKRQLDIVKYLVSKGADVNARAKNGFTPLHLAASLTQVDVVAFLVDSGANPEATTNGRSPLDLARTGRNMEVIPYYSEVLRNVREERERVARERAEQKKREREEWERSPEGIAALAAEREREEREREERERKRRITEAEERAERARSPRGETVAEQNSRVYREIEQRQAALKEQEERRQQASQQANRQRAGASRISIGASERDVRRELGSFDRRSESRSALGERVILQYGAGGVTVIMQNGRVVQVIN
jgi:flagellar biosynthesis GTPase FlhF